MMTPIKLRGTGTYKKHTAREVAIQIIFLHNLLHLTSANSIQCKAQLSARLETCGLQIRWMIKCECK